MVATLEVTVGQLDCTFIRYFTHKKYFSLVVHNSLSMLTINSSFTGELF